MDFASLMTTETLAYVLAGILVAVILWSIRLEVKMRRLLSGKDARSLEDTILHIKRGHDILTGFRNEVELYLETVENRLRKSIRGVETIRFNPFKGIGAGGNQSFSTVFLNEEGDGVVISTLYARERMSFFSKPVARFSSPHELTDEEREAIKKARASVEGTRRG